MTIQKQIDKLEHKLRRIIEARQKSIMAEGAIRRKLQHLFNAQFRQDEKTDTKRYPFK